MHRVMISLMVCFFMLAGSAFALEMVEIDTSRGKITLELDDQRAPISVANFLKYANDGFYDGTVFHRVINNFMIQGGGFDTDLKRKQTGPAIKNEADNGLRNERGTISMARTQVVDSATSQFFINLKDNAFLDHRNKSSQGYGYAVFGKVVEGMDVVDQIGKARTQRKSAMFADLPVESVVIKSVRPIK